ncbi:MAG: nucleotidyltransferase [Flavobacteriaceae bacterium]|nr:nucleotidyltransferase [Flavobacteriaceae bacterium]
MLSRKEQDMIINMMKPYSPIKIGVFGFVSHREETENCDIDIAYLIEGGIGFFEKCE